ASGFVGPIGSLGIGVAAGVVCYWGCTGLKHMFGYDDALDAFGVHAVGGIVGALLTGVFAVEQYGGTAGAFYGHVQQLINQCIGVDTIFVYDVIVSLIILKIVDIFIGLRVSEEVEREGLDLALPGETVHCRNTVRAESRPPPPRRGAPAQAGAPHFFGAGAGPG